ncbi:uncharacterized protein BJ171DRAFT_477789 [Polychytrium aggregatum]|uniref:uncharacterized protein n=1 Tax=Polychytrium aggregatum TaxID=110093 RepID=UPI0022FE8382|nr:uncharacterized protein BJ171DRAFT_477789 [Polychytrium aggregatum]KAI9197424.1 hypothetical protein BJ171DRAFT_477789 [Polychytrium aggregatum]
MPQPDPPVHPPQRAKNDIVNLKLADLKKALNDGGGRKTGNKDQLRRNLEILIDNLYRIGSYPTLRAVIQAIHEGSGRRGQWVERTQAPATTSSTSVVPHQSFNTNAATSQGPSRPGAAWELPPDFTPEFNIAPYYSKVKQLVPLRIFDGVTVEHNPYCEEFEILRDDQTRVFAPNSNLRVRLYVGLFESHEKLKSSSVHKIRYPRGPKIQINGKDWILSSKLEGLKGKPDTAQGADLTPFLQSNKKNYIDLTPGQKYGADSFLCRLCLEPISFQKYLMTIDLVQKEPIDNLIEIVQKRPHISKQSVLHSRKAQADDEDEVASSSEILSLRDPVSRVPIQVAVRSSECKHIQCFDCESFLRLNENISTWKCPICDKYAFWTLLAVDDYFMEFVEEANRLQKAAGASQADYDQVELMPDGNWKIKDSSIAIPAAVTPVKKRSVSEIVSLDSDDDDESDSAAEPPRKIVAAIPLPPTPQHPPPQPPSQQPARRVSDTAARRPQESLVIDLTLSDEEEGSPPPTEPYGVNKCIDSGTRTTQQKGECIRPVISYIRV